MEPDPRRRRRTPDAAVDTVEMSDEPAIGVSANPATGVSSPTTSRANHSLEAALYIEPLRKKERQQARWRRLLGLFLLAMVLLMWTASNFLGSSIMADNTYNKPYFIVYFNTAFLALAFIPYAIQLWYQRSKTSRSQLSTNNFTYSTFHDTAKNTMLTSSHAGGSPAHSVISDETTSLKSGRQSISLPPMDVKETFWVAVKFAPIWFIANYLSVACLAYATVASATILLSTSGAFTLLIGSLWGVEKFTAKKLFGTLSCLGGVSLIALLDYYGDQETRGSFPYKNPNEVILGDVMALLSAVAYGIYATFLSRSVGDESRINIFLFFGFIGIIDILIMWPGLFIFHWTGLETFAFPPTEKVWDVIIVNALGSDVADIFWGLAVLITSPLVITVGLSLSIPVSLLGEKLVQAKSSTPLYWFGAMVVVFSFILVNHETKQTTLRFVKEEDEESRYE